MLDRTNPRKTLARASTVTSRMSRRSARPSPSTCPPTGPPLPPRPRPRPLAPQVARAPKCARVRVTTSALSEVTNT
jgi:hypothetical protein